MTSAQDNIVGFGFLPCRCVQHYAPAPSVAVILFGVVILSVASSMAVAMSG